MPQDRFDFLDRPLQELQEHLVEELARNPYTAPGGPDSTEGDPHESDDDLPEDDQAPDAGPETQPDGPA